VHSQAQCRQVELPKLAACTQKYAPARKQWSGTGRSKAAGFPKLDGNPKNSPPGSRGLIRSSPHGVGSPRGEAYAARNAPVLPDPQSATEALNVPPREAGCATVKPSVVVLTPVPQYHVHVAATTSSSNT